MKNKKSALLALCGVACMVGSIQIASAVDTNASATQLNSGYENASKTVDGKCGAGKCGANKKASDAKCAAGKCGADKKSK
ncbi:MAG: hypothetical protein RLZZ210_42 [Pseudomonadota bacterium]|jgi:uncharacterized low-complexity protein